ncbi:MAG: hypothetical protein K2X43_18275 [Hyphomonadaceae bacterium]|jgi:hypothetical protein|nr:hypothetical protein [Hyphomonadaceae bacterium]
MDDEDRQDRSPLSPNRKCESFWTLTEGDTVLIGDEQDEMERLLWTRNCGTATSVDSWAAVSTKALRSAPRFGLPHWECGHGMVRFNSFYFSSLFSFAFI